MTRREQLQLFGDKLDALYNWAVDELDLDYPSIIGVLQVKITSVTNDALTEDEDNEDSSAKSK